MSRGVLSADVVQLHGEDDEEKKSAEGGYMKRMRKEKKEARDDDHLLLCAYCSTLLLPCWRGGHRVRRWLCSRLPAWGEIERCGLERRTDLDGDTLLLQIRLAFVLAGIELHLNPEEQVRR